MLQNLAQYNLYKYSQVHRSVYLHSVIDKVCFFIYFAMLHFCYRIRLILNAISANQINTVIITSSEIAEVRIRFYAP